MCVVVVTKAEQAARLAHLKATILLAYPSISFQTVYLQQTMWSKLSKAYICLSGLQSVWLIAQIGQKITQKATVCYPNRHDKVL